MADVLKQLEQYAAAAADTVPPTDFDRVRRTRGRRSRLPLLVAAAAVMIVGIAASLVVLDRDESRDPVVTDTTASTLPSTTAETPTTSTNPTPEPSPMRTFPVIAVTDSEYLVWSGEAGSEAAVRADGFAVDLVTGSVREIPNAPIGGRSGATGVWTGSELLVCCGHGLPDRSAAPAAAWNPATGIWRTLEPPPAAIAQADFPTSVWTGEVMVVVTGTPAAAAVYDPVSDRWTESPAPPITGRLPDSAWTGEQVIVWDSRVGTQIYPPSGAVSDQGWSWEPGADQWRPLPALPEAHRTQGGSMAWTGREIVVWGNSTSDYSTATGAAWQVGADAWTPMASSPQGAVEDFDGTPGSQSLAPTPDGRVLVKAIDGGDLSDQVYIYDPQADQWSTNAFAISGYHPDMTVANGRVFIPNRDSPIAGTL